MTTRSGIPRFSGGFKSFSVSQFTDRERSTESRLHVYSQGSRPKVVEYLWLKFLWDELNRLEWELFLACPEVLNSEVKFSALRAINLVGKRKVRNRLVKCPFLPDSDKPTWLRYQGFKRLNVEISRETRSLPKVAKFSGYVKSGSAVGSKSARKSSYLDLLVVNENDYSLELVFDWFSYLTIGETSFLPKKESNHPDETLK